MLDGLTIPNCAKGTATAKAKLNVRPAPQPTGAVLGQLAVAETVTVWAVVNGWAIVQTASGLTGWASMAYLAPVGALVA
jgi:hypothetical protein